MLSGESEPIIANSNSLGGIAVLAFFAISGFLITGSFLNSISLRDYMAKRMARIFPALIVCALVMVYIVGGLFGSDGSSATFFDSILKILKISVFGRAELPSVTNGYIFKESINGSLWSLKVEFGLYILLALLLSIYKRLSMPVIALASLCLLMYTVGFSTNPLSPKIVIYASVGIGFFTGSSLYFCKHLLAKKRTKILLSCLSVLLILNTATAPFSLMLSSIGFSLIILTLGLFFTDRIIKSRFDISYGIYLYSFPVQQLIINETDLGFYISMFASVIIVIPISYMSWRLVERPAIRYVHKKSTELIHN